MLQRKIKVWFAEQWYKYLTVIAQTDIIKGSNRIAYEVHSNTINYWLLIVSPSMSSPMLMVWVSRTLLSKAKLYSRDLQSMFFVLRNLTFQIIAASVWFTWP